MRNLLPSRPTVPSPIVETANFQDGIKKCVIMIDRAKWTNDAGHKTSDACSYCGRIPKEDDPNCAGCGAPFRAIK